jgi:hypothetical protein
VCEGRTRLKKRVSEVMMVVMEGGRGKREEGKGKML